MMRTPSPLALLRLETAIQATEHTQLFDLYAPWHGFRSDHLPPLSKFSLSFQTSYRPRALIHHRTTRHIGNFRPIFTAKLFQGNLENLLKVRRVLHPSISSRKPSNEVIQEVVKLDCFKHLMAAK